LSGRHGHKRKRKKLAHDKAPASTIHLQPGEQDTEAKPEGIEHTIAEHTESQTMKWRTTRKPDPFDVALYGLIVAAAVAVIYLLQLRVMDGQLDEMRQDQRAWVGAGSGKLLLIPKE
jgi:hypothetical protein